MYIHRKPCGEVFYVGKGKHKRAWSPHGRNPFWKRTVARYGYIVQIVEQDLSNEQALELEEFIISYCKLRSDGGTLTNLTLGGTGCVGLKVSDETKCKLSKKNKGSLNANSDKGIYNFTNFYTGETYTGTRQDFTEKYKIKVSDLFNSKVLTTLSWCLTENLHKIIKPKYDCREYTFKHISGAVITATRREFKDQTGTDPKGLFKTGRGKNKITYGWSIIN